MEAQRIAGSSQASTSAPERLQATSAGADTSALERRIELLVKKDGQVESAPFGDAETGAEGDSHEIRR